MILEHEIALYQPAFSASTQTMISILSDAIVCEITGERNGIYELYMEYPREGRGAESIAPDTVITAPTSEPRTGSTSTVQPFRVYKLERGTDGRLIVYAEHISYELLNIPVKPFTASGVSAALSGLVTNSVQTNPFSVSTDKTTPGTFTVSTPTAFRSLLMGQQGSILDVFGGGEYLFDWFSVALKASRGADRGVVIEYGKSIQELTTEMDISGIYTGVCPYWKGGEDGETVVTIPEGAAWNSYADSLSYKRTAVVDFSGDFETQPTEAQLRAKAQSYLAANGATGIPNTITVQVVPYLDSADFETRSGYPPTITMTAGEITNVQPSYSSRARVIRLCDTVTIECPPLGVSKKAKVVKTVWDAIALRYKELTIGQVAQSLAGTIVAIGNTADGAAAAAAQTFLPVSGGTLYGNLDVAGDLDVTGAITKNGNPYLKTSSRGISISCAANSATSGSAIWGADLAEQTGYTPVGVIGYSVSGTNANRIFPSALYLSGDATSVHYVVRNTGSTAFSGTLNVVFLFQAN